MRRLVITLLTGGVLLIGAAPAAPPDHPVSFIKVGELKALLDRGARVDIIDVRTWDAYQEMHIKGARSMPVRALTTRANEISRTAPVVFYWTCPHALARGASNIMYEMGWRNQRVLDEGLPGWHAKGYPVVGTSISNKPRH